MHNTITSPIPVTISPPVMLPLYGSQVAAGFPSPADDFVERNLDLGEFLIKHPAATFFARVQGDSMVGAGIHNGDYIVVDKSLTATNGAIVLAVVNGEVTVKSFHKSARGIELHPANPAYKPIKVPDGEDLQLWGVVTAVVRKLVA